VRISDGGIRARAALQEEGGTAQSGGKIVTPGSGEAQMSVERKGEDRRDAGKNFTDSKKLQRTMAQRPNLPRASVRAQW
jgi:hypothetical protein